MGATLRTMLKEARYSIFPAGRKRPSSPVPTLAKRVCLEVACEGGWEETGEKLAQLISLSKTINTSLLRRGLYTVTNTQYHGPSHCQPLPPPPPPPPQPKTPSRHLGGVAHVDPPPPVDPPASHSPDHNPKLHPGTWVEFHM